ncbi:hypothetical protein SORBI_3007G142000 [Sorghum bicolor]|uniref:Uncharacterized protein n=1 Tax=Sorghum bicolor TaxID=4558 RepID=C5YLL5_SORBI|nr:hypothetical protein SORBI_3007G142000 [Sorghum bicolor]
MTTNARASGTTVRVRASRGDCRGERRRDGGGFCGRTWVGEAAPRRIWEGSVDEDLGGGAEEDLGAGLRAGYGRAEEYLGGGALRRRGSGRDGGGGEERRIWERGSERKREPGGMRVAGAGRNRERRMSHENHVIVTFADEDAGGLGGRYGLVTLRASAVNPSRPPSRSKVLSFRTRLRQTATAPPPLALLERRGVSLLETECICSDTI